MLMSTCYLNCLWYIINSNNTIQNCFQYNMQANINNIEVHYLAWKYKILHVSHCELMENLCSHKPPSFCYACLFNISWNHMPPVSQRKLTCSKTCWKSLSYYILYVVHVLPIYKTTNPNPAYVMEVPTSKPP